MENISYPLLRKRRVYWRVSTTRVNVRACVSTRGDLARISVTTRVHKLDSSLVDTREATVFFASYILLHSRISKVNKLPPIVFLCLTLYLSSCHGLMLRLVHRMILLRPRGLTRSRTLSEFLEQLSANQRETTRFDRVSNKLLISNLILSTVRIKVYYE